MQKCIPLLAAALALAGCASGPATPLTATRVTPEAPQASTTSGLHDYARVAVFDARTFGEQWTRAYSDRMPPPPAPAIDFAREFVLVAALGEHATGGYRIEIASVTARGGRIEARVVTSTPGKGCVVAAMMTQPLDVVRVPRPRAGELDVRFADTLVVRDCR